MPKQQLVGESVRFLPSMARGIMLKSLRTDKQSKVAEELSYYYGTISSADEITCCSLLARLF